MDRRKLIGKLIEGVRRVGLPLALAGGVFYFGRLVDRHYAIVDWLFFRYAAYWLLSLVFVVACLSSGHALVRGILGTRTLPFLEHVTVSFAAGVYVFFLGTLYGGFLGLLGRRFFFALPFALVVLGAPSSWWYARRAVRHFRGAWRRSPRPPPWAFAVTAFGLLGLFCVYVAVLTPNNAAFDARWYHLGIAEHYAASGAVRKFPEGWLPGTAPHLASLLYTWAFLIPSGQIFDRIELAAHVEITTFLFTLLGVSALVRRLVRPRVVGRAYRYAWIALFLFPGVFLYDSSLCLGADHVAAVFAVPIYLGLLRAWRSLEPRDCVLLALALSGALLTKYTGGFILVAPAVLVVVLRAVLLALRPPWRWAVARIRRRAAAAPGAPDPTRWNPLAGPFAALAAGLVFTAPHWVKNLVWYGDPVYPVLHKLLRPRPWTADSALRFDVGFKAAFWPAERTSEGLDKTVHALATFSFIPNDWPNFHGASPVFGSLFTLSLGALPFLKNTKRVWGLYASTHVGIFVWYWINHQDRYLQAAVPWMAAATAALLALIWQRGLITRLVAGVFVALQIVWGADVYFMPAHVFLGIPMKAVIDLVSRVPAKSSGDRFAFSDGFVAVGRALPPGSKVLLHEWHPHLGLAAPSVSDCPIHQGGISYLRVPAPREVYDQLHGFGVTHLVYQTGQPREPDTLAGETVFYNFVHRYAGTPISAGGWFVAPMPKQPPPEGGAPDPVLVLTCGKGPPPGLYHLEDLAIPSLDKQRPPPKPFSDPAQPLAALVPTAMAVAQDQSCASLPSGLDASFVRAGTRDPYAIWVRR